MNFPRHTTLRLKAFCSEESRAKQELFTFHSPRALKEVFNKSITKFLTPLYFAVSRISVQTELTAECTM